MSETRTASSSPSHCFVDGQCQIRYRRLDGVVREWGIGCDAAQDTNESIAAHLRRWIPNAEFLGCCITRVKDAVVISDSRKIVIAGAKTPKAE